MFAGDAAEWIETVTDGEATGAVVDALREIFPPNVVPEPTGVLVTRWRADEWARGSYSNLPPGTSGVHYDVMAAPLGGADGRVLWAGEATNRAMPTTAAGAFDSGLREAFRITQARGRLHDSGVVAILTARAARLLATGAININSSST